jgi:outer membrane lipoprotein-sorting protein
MWLASPLQAQTTLDQVFAKMDEIAKTFRTVDANLERTKVTVIVDDKDVASGRLYYMRAGKEPRLKLEISKGSGAPQYLLIDKGKGLFYQPKIKQVQAFSLGNHANVVDQFMAIGFGQSSSDLKNGYQVQFAGEEVVDGKKTAMLDLTPKAALAGIRAVRLWMDEQKGVSLQVKVTETGGDYAIYKYSNIKINNPIPDSVFDLKLPSDVHVNKL